MSATPSWRRYLRFLGSDPVADADDEVAFHLAMRVEDLMRQGASEREARERARREFGDVERVRSELQDIGRRRQVRERRAGWWDELRHDLRFAARTLRRSPGFAAIAVLTLALGIGASTAMFTLVNSVVLRPLSYADPERLVALWGRAPDGNGEAPSSPADFFDWKEQSTAFADMAAYQTAPVNLTGEGEAERIVARLTTANYFAVLGAGARMGRTYLPGEDAENFVVLSDALWRRRFGGDPAVVGRSVEIGGNRLAVIGVMPADFRSVGDRPDVWVPVQFDPEWRGRYLSVVGRLRAGVGLEQASQEMDALGRRLAEAFPDSNTGWGINLVPMHEQVTGEVRPTLLVLLGAVGVLLLIACANVANLLLGRAVTRRREMAVRLSLGATRGRLARQTLTESVLLAAVAGALGLALAVWGTGALVRFLPADLALPRLDEVRVDGRVLGFSLAVSLLTGILFGIVPALFGSTLSQAAALRDATRGTTSGRNGVRRALVVVEVALAVVLLVGAGLLGRTLQRLLEVQTGMSTQGLLTMQLTLSGERYEEEDALRAFVGTLLPRLEALPGADAASVDMSLPLTGARVGHIFWRADRPRPRPGEELDTDIRIVAGDYFRSMGIPVRQGRAFDERDGEGAPTVMVVNEELARRHFPGESPVGKIVTFPWLDGDVTGEVVGVVGSVRQSGPTEDAAPALYRPFAQMPTPEFSVVVRTDGEPMALAEAATAAVREIDANQPVAAVRTMAQVAADTVARPRFNLYMLGGFAAVALLLAGLGLYGIISYSVAQRKQEIGVRVALGARRSDVLRLVAREGATLTALGLAIGIAAALASTRVLQGMLFGVSGTDPVTLGGVALFLGLVALLASVVPGHRAARVDPMVALRAE